MTFSLFGPGTTLGTIVSERRRDASVVEQLEKGKLPGRIRTGLRTAPTSNSDVVRGDAEGDVIVDGTYIYTLVSTSGSLKWHRVTLIVGW